MANDLLTLGNDPISILIQEDKDSAKIIKDQINGYDRIVPRPDVLEDMGALYAGEIVKGDADWKETFEKQRRAENAYEGNGLDANPDRVLTVPIAKRSVNQQASRIANAILTKDPFITWKPIDGGSYELPSGLATDSGGVPLPPEMVPGMEDQPPQPFMQTTTVPSDEAAKLFQDFTQYQLSECVNFEQLVEDTVQAVHVGENPTYWRIDYNPYVRYAKVRKFIKSSKGVQIYGIEDTEVVPRDIVTIRHVPGPNITMPIQSEDIQSAWWVAEKTPLTNIDLWQGFKSGRFDFCRQDWKKGSSSEEIQKITEILGFSESQLGIETDVEYQRAMIERRVASNPVPRTHDCRTVWFFHPFRVTRQDGTKAIEIRSCLGILHVPTRQFLNMMVNWAWNGQRLLVPHFRKRRPHSMTGMSAAGDIAPIQSLMSDIYNLQIKNMVQTNIKVFLIREDSPTWTWFDKNPGALKPGARIPFADPEDISPVHLGTQANSMAPEIMFLDQFESRLMVDSDYTSGLSAPNRTPAATVAQTDAKNAEQPLATMRPLRRSIAKGVEFYIETIAQFSAYVTIPYLDPVKKQTITKLIGFPRDAIANHFSLRVTATGDEDTEQARFERAGLLIQDVDQANEALMKLGMIIVDPGAAPIQKKIAAFGLLRRERLLAEKIRTFRLDTQNYVIDDKLLQEWTMEAQQFAQQQQEQGGQNGQLPPAQTGGPGQPQGPGGGPVGPPPQPGVQGVPQPPPLQNSGQ